MYLLVRASKIRVFRKLTFVELQLPKRAFLVDFFSRTPKDLFHLFPSSQFVNELIKISNLPGQRIFNFLYPVSTNYSGDKR